MLNSNGFQSGYGKQNFAVSPNIGSLSRKQSEDAPNLEPYDKSQRSVSTKLNHTSYNMWPYGGAYSTDKHTRKSEKLKPMTNQKARALVQRDYYLNRQNNSHKLLIKKDNNQQSRIKRDHVGSQDLPSF